MLPLIKTILKFWNMIGYHQSDLSINRTGFASCCCYTFHLVNCKLLFYENVKFISQICHSLVNW